MTMVPTAKSICSRMRLKVTIVKVCLFLGLIMLIVFGSGAYFIRYSTGGTRDERLLKSRLFGPEYCNQKILCSPSLKFALHLHPQRENSVYRSIYRYILNNADKCCFLCVCLDSLDHTT